MDQVGLNLWFLDLSVTEDKGMGKNLFGTKSEDLEEWSVGKLN